MAVRGKKNERRENEIAEGRMGKIHAEVRGNLRIAIRKGRVTKSETKREMRESEN